MFPLISKFYTTAIMYRELKRALYKSTRIIIVIFFFNHNERYQTINQSQVDSNEAGESYPGSVQKEAQITHRLIDHKLYLSRGAVIKSGYLLESRLISDSG